MQRVNLFLILILIFWIIIQKTTRPNILFNLCLSVFIGVKKIPAPHSPRLTISTRRFADAVGWSGNSNSRIPRPEASRRLAAMW